MQIMFALQSRLHELFKTIFTLKNDSHFCIKTSRFIQGFAWSEVLVVKSYEDFQNFIQYQILTSPKEIPVVLRCMVVAAVELI